MRTPSRYSLRPRGENINYNERTPANNKRKADEVESDADENSEVEGKEGKKYHQTVESEVEEVEADGWAPETPTPAPRAQTQPGNQQSTQLGSSNNAYGGSQLGHLNAAYTTILGGNHMSGLGAFSAAPKRMQPRQRVARVLDFKKAAATRQAARAQVQVPTAAPIFRPPVRYDPSLMPESIAGASSTFTVAVTTASVGLGITFSSQPNIFAAQSTSFASGPWPNAFPAQQAKLNSYYPDNPINFGHAAGRNLWDQPQATWPLYPGGASWGYDPHPTRLTSASSDPQVGLTDPSSNLVNFGPLDVACAGIKPIARGSEASGSTRMQGQIPYRPVHAANPSINPYCNNPYGVNPYAINTGQLNGPFMPIGVAPWGDIARRAVSLSTGFSSQEYGFTGVAPYTGTVSQNTVRAVYSTGVQARARLASSSSSASNHTNQQHAQPAAHPRSSGNVAPSRTSQHQAALRQPDTSDGESPSDRTAAAPSTEPTTSWPEYTVSDGRLVPVTAITEVSPLMVPAPWNQHDLKKWKPRVQPRIQARTKSGSATSKPQAGAKPGDAGSNSLSKGKEPAVPTTASSTTPNNPAVSTTPPPSWTEYVVSDRRLVPATPITAISPAMVRVTKWSVPPFSSQTISPSGSARWEPVGGRVSQDCSAASTAPTNPSIPSPQSTTTVSNNALPAARAVS
ncbi:hypothetical protein N0V88_007384 [Collariella sp. IMI 366227]|nr:hypothetical protein N0V88_007384 [Collariella sp. IMI 366227]